MSTLMRSSPMGAALVRMAGDQSRHRTLSEATQYGLPTAIGGQNLYLLLGAALQLERRHAPFKQLQFSSLGRPRKAERSRAEPTALATIAHLPICPGSLGSAPHLSQPLVSQSKPRLLSLFAQQQQQQNVVEAALQHVSSTASTHGSMVERSGCAPCSMRATMPSECGRLHGRCIRRLACSSCEQAGGRFRVSQPLGAPA